MLQVRKLVPTGMAFRGFYVHEDGVHVPRSTKKHEETFSPVRHSARVFVTEIELVFDALMNSSCCALYVYAASPERVSSVWEHGAE
jgi:hypothetical protein